MPVLNPSFEDAGALPGEAEHWALSAVTRLPHTLVWMNMNKIHAAMSQVRTVIGGLTRGIPLGLFDRGLTALDDLEVNFYPLAKSLGVSLPSNAPAVNSLWIPAPVLKMPVLLSSSTPR